MWSVLCVTRASAGRYTLLVLPVARLPFAYPLDCLIDALGPRCIRLGIGDPLAILVALSGCERVEVLLRALVFLQRPGEVGMNTDFDRCLLCARHDDALVVELHRLLDVTSHHLLRRKVLDARDLAELAHRLFGDIRIVEDE